MQRYSHLVDGVDEALDEIGTQLDTLPTKQDHKELKLVTDKILERIVYAIMFIGIVGTVGLGTYVWIIRDIDARIAKQSNGRQTMHLLDDKGNKQTFYIER